ncbi:MAG: Manganese-exporting P-type ATPase [Desulfovibrio sp.]
MNELPGLLHEYRIVHSIAGRMRMRPRCPETIRRNFAAVEALLQAELPALFPGASITVSRRTGSVLVEYAETTVPAKLLKAEGGESFSLRKGKVARHLTPRPAGESGITPQNPIPGKIRSILFYPPVLSGALAVIRSIPYIFSAVKAFVRGRLNLDVLDGAALVVCLVQRDFRTLSSVTFFFALGEFLTDWTRKKSRASLAESLALNIETVWVREGDLERRIPFADVKKGDLVIVRAGAAIPVDGTVADGQGMVNQASMTGEPLPVHRTAGATVYAGTILEEGELIVAASRVGSETRINSIVRTIEESEAVKASIQGKYERMADAIVPYNFLLSGIVFLLTRNLARAGSVLLVDYSCAIRLATPLSIFTGMREAADRGILIKGGKYMEAVAEADTVVFDKTGTLTKARPKLAGVIPFGGRSRESVLRLAACLEEHFAHPVGQAVVHASDAEGLEHREEHAKVEYIVAHGIASIWREQRVLIGSAHFVFDDENVAFTKKQAAIVEEESARGRSILYLSIGGDLAGLLLIEDEIRENAAAVVEALYRDGVKRVIMLTGDGPKTAASIAKHAGIREFKAAMLPEEKAAFVKELKRTGARVAMVGDGINDSPALSAADVGIAMQGGADMAREVADIVLVNENLESLLVARSLSRVALRRIRKGFHASLYCNSLFLVGGMTGFIMPRLSAFLHNATTAAIAVNSVSAMDLETEDPHNRRG